eukprot:gene18215-24666_t
MASLNNSVVKGYPASQRNAIVSTWRPVAISRTSIIVSTALQPNRAHGAASSFAPSQGNQKKGDSFNSLIIGADGGQIQINEDSSHSNQVRLESLKNNALIKKCLSWTELSYLLEDRADTFNEFNVVAALGKMVSLRRSDAQHQRGDPAQGKSSVSMDPITQPEDMWLLDQLLQMADGCLHQLNSRSIANLMTTLCKLGTPECVSLMRQVMPHALVMMPWFEPQHLSNLMWGVARMGVEPGDEWLESFLAATEISMEGFTPQGLSNVMWGLARIGVAPDGEWMSAYVSQLRHRLHDFTPVDVAETMYAVASLDINVDSYLPGLMCALQQQLLRPAARSSSPLSAISLSSPRQLQAAHGIITSSSSTAPRRGGASDLELGPQALANAMWALAHLSVTPSKAWMEKIWEEVDKHLREFDPHALSSLLWAAAKLGQLPPPQLMLSIYHYSARRLKEFQPQSLSNFVWALATLSAIQPPRWMPASLPSVGAGDTEDSFAPSTSSAAHGAASASRTRQQRGGRGSSSSSSDTSPMMKPSKEWMDVFLEVVSSRLAEFNGQNVSNVMWSLVQLKVTPEPQWAANLVYHLQACHTSMVPQHVSTVMWSLAKMGFSLNKEASALLEGLVRVQLLKEGLAQDMRSMGSAGLPDLEPTAGALCFSSQELSNIIYAFAKFKHTPASDVMDGLLLRMRVHMRTAASGKLPHQQQQHQWGSTGEAGAAAGSMPDHGYANYAAVGGGANYTGVGGTTMQAQGLANSIWALSVLRVQPSQEWFGDFWSACSALLPTFNAKDLAQTVYSMARLGWYPGCDLQACESEAELSCDPTEPREPADRLTLADRLAARGFGPNSHKALAPLVPPLMPPALREGAAPPQEGKEEPPSGRDDSWARPLLAAAIQLLPVCNPQDFSNLAWGLAQLGIRPGQQWLNQLAFHLSRNAETCPGGDLAITTWALGKMQYKPAASSMLTVETALYRRMPTLKPRELAATIWAFKAMEYQLHAEWLETYANNCYMLAGKFSQQDWAVVVYSLAAMVERDPSASFYVEDLLILPQLESKIATFEASELAMIMFACGMLGTKSGRLLSRLLSSCRAHISDFSALQLSGIMCACAKLKHVPGPDFMAAWFVEVEMKMPILSSSVMACSLWAVATLRATSDTGRWVNSKAETGADARASAPGASVDASSSGGVGAGVGSAGRGNRYGLQLSPVWMQTVCLVLPQRLRAMSVQELAMTVWALGESHHPMSKSFCKTLDEGVKACLPLYDDSTKKAMKLAMKRVKLACKGARDDEDATKSSLKKSVKKKAKQTKPKVLFKAVAGKEGRSKKKKRAQTKPQLLCKAAAGKEGSSKKKKTQAKPRLFFKAVA